MALPWPFPRENCGIPPQQVKSRPGAGRDSTCKKRLHFYSHKFKYIVSQIPFKDSLSEDISNVAAVLSVSNIELGKANIAGTGKVHEKFQYFYHIKVVNMFTTFM